MKVKTFFITSLVMGLLAVLGGSTGAQAATCTITWAAPVSGEWGDRYKWSPAMVPASTDDVCITVNGDYTVALYGHRTVNSLTIGAVGNAGVQTLAIVGDPWSSSASLTVTNGMTNGGVINLTEVDGRGMGSTLAVSDGVLTNTGTINSVFYNCSTCSGAPRWLRASVDNLGTINVDVILNLDKTGAIYNNTGTINIPSGKRLIVTGAPTVNQNGGTISLNGAYTQGGGTFNSNGGSITSAGGFTLDSGTFNLAGISTLSPVVTLLGGSLNIAAGATTPASFVIYRNAMLSGDIAAGQTMTVVGDPWASSATLTAATGFTNAGVINLTETDGRGMGSRLVVSSGVLKNTGTINSNYLNCSTCSAPR